MLMIFFAHSNLESNQKYQKTREESQHLPEIQSAEVNFEFQHRRSNDGATVLHFAEESESPLG